MKRKFKILYRWYSLEIKGPDGKWEDAGNFYEEDSLRECKRHMGSIDFLHEKVRMIEHVTMTRQVGKVKGL